jgi:hypothetical protein
MAVDLSVVRTEMLMSGTSSAINFLAANGSKYDQLLPLCRINVKEQSDKWDGNVKKNNA